MESNKAQGHDEIPIWMIKLCYSSIANPFENECFLKEWKTAKIVPVHNKDKQYHYCLFVVNIWKIISNSLFKYLDNKNILNGNQSGFHPGDSCVYQLL